MTDELRAAFRAEKIRYAVRDILVVAAEAKKAGKDLLYLNIGDPLKFDHRTPAHMVEAVASAMRAGQNGYAPSEGTPEARAAVGRWAERKGLRAVRDIYVGNGASECIELALTALVNRGEEVLVPNPGYPLYDAILAKLEAAPVYYPLDPESGWQPDSGGIERLVTPRTRAIVLINPNNPTGSLASRETLLALLDVARRHGLPVLSDEIYDEIVFDGLPHVATASLANDVPILTFGGLSKCYLACGWRIGWGVMTGPAAVVSPWVDAVARMCRARLCASTPMQAAVAAAIDGPKDHLKDLIAKLTRRRDLTVERLNAIDGVRCVPPRGAFYAFPSVDTGETREPDEKLVARLIRETGVVVVHGSGFGPGLGKAHFRIVFAPTEDVLSRAYDRIAGFLRR